MYQVFNCGHRLEVYVDATVANDIISIAKQFNVNAKIIGRVENFKQGKQLTLESEHGVFHY